MDTSNGDTLMEAIGVAKNNGYIVEFLFKEKSNYLHFLNWIKKYIFPVSNIIAYNLLPNHFHLVIQIRNETDANTEYN